jgi:hypothetical protein
MTGHLAQQHPEYSEMWKVERPTDGLADRN